MADQIDTSFLDHLAPNVAVQFLDRVTTSPDAEAYRYPVGDGWESVTWRETGERVEKLAAGQRPTTPGVLLGMPSVGAPTG